MSESTRGASRQSGNKAANKDEAGNNGKRGRQRQEETHKERRGCVAEQSRAESDVKAAAVD